MHVRELVELAALLSGHADVLLSDTAELTRDGMSEYWSASKARQDRWSRSLQSLSQTPQPASLTEYEFVPAVVEPLLHEVLASEVLARVWAAIVCLFDARSSQTATTAVARSVLSGNQEVRCRALHWLLNGPLANSPHADAVNLVRRRCERWTDLLIANLCHLGDVSAFAFDDLRAREFARDIDQQRKSGTHHAAWSLAMTALRSALRVGIAREAFSRDANRRISAALLACLGPDLFSATGTLRPAWLMRLQRVAADTEGMLSELLALDTPTTPWADRFSM